MTIDSVKLFKTGQLVQGSFGTTGDPLGAPDVFEELSVSRIVDEATIVTSGEGTGVRGICFHCTGHDVRISSTTQRGASGDVAWFYGYGNWHLWNIWKSGGPGRLVRMVVMSQRSDPQDNWLYNSAKFNGTEYGMMDYYFLPGDSVAGQFYGTSAYIFNNTMGNQINDTLGYWSPMADNGQVPPGQHFFFKNNFGFNIGNNTQKASANGQPNNGKPQMAVNNGGWSTIGTDTSNNKYWKYATVAQLDSVSVLFSNSLGSFPYYVPTATSPNLLNAGVTNPLTSTDYIGNPYKVPPDLGYLQFTINKVNNYIPGLRGGLRKHLITK
jgi:hypothetical protein